MLDSKKPNFHIMLDSKKTNFHYNKIKSKEMIRRLQQTSDKIGLCNHTLGGLLRVYIIVFKDRIKTSSLYLLDLLSPTAPV